MKLLFVFLLVCFSFGASGQVLVDGTNINQADIEYCELSANNRAFSAYPVIFIDYGVVYQSLGATRQVISGLDRKPIRFQSAMDALNFMLKNGWQFVSSHVTFDKDGSPGRSIYLLKKKSIPKP